MHTYEGHTTDAFDNYELSSSYVCVCVFECACELVCLFSRLGKLNVLNNIT